MKFRQPDENELLIIIDRLTRFKNPATKYKRVFFEILTKFLIEPKFSIQKLEESPPESICELVSKIFNYHATHQEPSKIQEMLIKEEGERFYIDNYTLNLMQTPLNFEAALKKIPPSKNHPPNVRRLHACLKNPAPKGFLFPIEKVLLCEGITEEILLPEFAKILKKDFNELGIFILGAGGKNQVARKFYELYEILKIPIFILLDSDAQKTACSIEPKLRAKDKIHIIQNGEFEDVLPLPLIQKSLNSNFSSYELVQISELQKGMPMAHILHELYKSKGWGEFKKAEFAGMVKKNISGMPDVSVEIEKILKLLTE